jgi:hypothetical protein
MKNKVALLKDKAEHFRALLAAHADTNTDAMLLLRWLTSLFNEVSQGKIIPPKRYEFRSALGRDSPFYEPTSPFSRVEADFISALEDWPSKPWYQALAAGQK